MMFFLSFFEVSILMQKNVKNGVFYLFFDVFCNYGLNTFSVTSYNSFLKNFATELT